MRQLRMAAWYFAEDAHQYDDASVGATGSGGQIFVCVSNLALAPWKGFVYLKWFMNDELPKSTKPCNRRRPLEQRLAHRPEVLERLRHGRHVGSIRGDDCTADQAEERVSEQVRQLAQDVLAQWRTKPTPTPRPKCRRASPRLFRHGKKKD